MACKIHRISGQGNKMPTRSRIALVEKESGFVVSVCLDSLPDIDRESRVATSLEVAKRFLQRSGGVEIRAETTPISYAFALSAELRMRGIAQRLSEKINAVLTAPLAPRAVDSALGISSSERLRWYKDGRLPTCGRSTLGHGNHTVQVPLFPFKIIAKLHAAPETIEAWRKMDAHRLRNDLPYPAKAQE